MRKKNEFESFCDELSDGQLNKVDYVRNQLRAKYKNDLNMLLMIKAEANEDDYLQYLSFRVSSLALITSCFGVVGSFAPKTGNVWIDSIISTVYLLLMIYAFEKIGIGDKFTSVRKWRKYILVVIDDLILESKQISDDQMKRYNKKNKKKK